MKLLLARSSLVVVEFVLVSSFSPPIDLSPTIAAAMAMLYTTNTNFLYASKENCSDDLKPQQSHALLFLFDLSCPPTTPCLLLHFFFTFLSLLPVGN